MASLATDILFFENGNCFLTNKTHSLWSYLGDFFFFAIHSLLKTWHLLSIFFFSLAHLDLAFTKHHWCLCWTGVATNQHWQEKLKQWMGETAPSVEQLVTAGDSKINYKYALFILKLFLNALRSGIKGSKGRMWPAGHCFPFSALSSGQWIFQRVPSWTKIHQMNTRLSAVRPNMVCAY